MDANRIKVVIKNSAKNVPNLMRTIEKQNKLWKN